MVHFVATILNNKNHVNGWMDAACSACWWAQVLTCLSRLPPGLLDFLFCLVAEFHLQLLCFHFQILLPLCQGFPGLGVIKDESVVTVKKNWQLLSPSELLHTIVSQEEISNFAWNWVLTGIWALATPCGVHRSVLWPQRSHHQQITVAPELFTES